MTYIVVAGNRQIAFPTTPTSAMVATFANGEEVDFQGRPEDMPPDIRARFTSEQQPQWAEAYTHLLTTQLQSRITALSDAHPRVARARGDVAIALTKQISDEVKRGALTAALEALNTALDEAKASLDANEKAILRNWVANYNLGLNLTFLP